MIAWLLVAGLLSPGAPLVRDISFRGPRGPDRAEMKVLLRDLVGAPAEPARVAEAVRRLEQVQGVGAVEVRHTRARRAAEGGRQVDLLFVYDDRRQRVSRYRLTEDDEPDLDESWRLLQRIQATDEELFLAEGRLFHPYLAAVDADVIRDYYRRLGYREVHVEPELTRQDDLVSVVMRIDPGPRSQVRRVRLLGSTLDDATLAALREALETKSEAWSSAEAEVADVARVRAAQCRAGYPEARVTVERTSPESWPDGPRPLTVDFKVIPGPLAIVRDLRVQGPTLPASLLRGLSLRPGRPYCPLQLDEAEARIRGWLKDHGHPRADVVPVVRYVAETVPLAAVDVALRVETEGATRVERIWFDGNRVTHEEVIRQMLSIREGELYRQSAVDASVQAIRRSGLFRRVAVRVLPGSERGRAYLFFDLVENNTISIDVLEQSLTFRNLDLSEWPGSFESFEQGAAFRGGGQQLTFYAQDDWQGVLLRDDYVHRYLVAELQANRRTEDEDGVEQTWYDVVGGFGVSALANRFAIIPFVQLEWTESDLPDDVELPVVSGMTFATLVGTRGSFDLNRRDFERIPYLGMDGQAHLRAAIPALGGDLGWLEYGLELRGHVPLGRNARQQHYVLRLRGSMTQVFPDEPGQLQAHHRVFPQARGYGSRGVGLTFESAATPGREVLLGGLLATSATAEVRLPIPWGSRNALSPFIDLAAAGDDEALPFADPYPGLGVALSFSFFGEKLEGVVYGAYPLRDTPDAEYFGGSIGGSF